MIRPSFRRILRTAVPLFLIWIGPPPAAAQPPTDHRADIVHNLCKFVVWPESAFSGDGAGLGIHLAGPGDANRDLTSLAGRRVRGRVIRISRPADVAGTPPDAQVLVIDGESRDRVDEVLSDLEGRPVLTISELPGFSARGGMIELVSTGDRVRFHINLAAARASGLIIQSPLLQIAHVLESLPAPSEARTQ